MSQGDNLDDGAQRPLLTEHGDQEYGSADGTAADAALEVGTFTRNLGALEAFAIIISIVIGSGIFTSPGSIDANVPSPGAALLIWLVGGLLAWTGASSLAELGTAIPGEGGVQPYLQHIFGDVFGFMAGWTWIVAVMPSTLAILSIVFIESVFTALGVTDQAGKIEHNTKATTRLNNFFVVTKFVAIFGVVVAGIVIIVLGTPDPDRDIGGRDWLTKPWFGFRNTELPDGSTIDWRKLSQWDLLGHYSAALYGALWAYSGWDKAIYISAELSAPARQLPLAINTAVPIILLCFIAANSAYYILLPWSLVSTTDSVAVTAITRLLGPAGGIVAAILVCLVVAGALLGNSFVAGRMTVAAANKNWFPRFLGFIGHFRAISKSDVDSSSSPTSSKSDAPLNALILSTILSTLYILFGNFRALLTFNGLGEYSFFFLTVVGVIVLRFREPDLRRPYKPFVLIPIIFAVVSGFIVVRGAVFAPVQAVILIGVWIIGVGFYQTRRVLRRRVEA